MIDEASRRWADFQGGRPITLPDGQEWFFYEPEATTRGGLPGWTFGDGVPRDVDEILSDKLTRITEKWSLAITDNERTSAIIEAAWFLLGRNYAVTPGEFERIMLGAVDWPEARQKALAGQLLILVGLACMRSTQLAEVV